MAIEFRCSQCDKQLRTPDDKAGLSAKCPQCGAQLTIPAAPPAVVEENIFDDDPPAAASSPLGQRGPVRAAARPCPMCGEMVPIGAARCPACGEAQALGRVQGEPRPLRATEVFSRAWAIYQKEMGVCLGAYAIVWGIMVGIGMVGNLAMMSAFPQPGRPPDFAVMLQKMMPALIVVTLLQTTAQLLLTPGLRRMMLRVACGEKAEVTDVFKGFQYVLRFIGASILVGLLFIATVVGIVLAFVAMMIAGGANEFAVLVVGLLAYMLALVVASLLVMPFFWPYSLVLIDRDAPGMRCLSGSLALTRGNRLQSALLLLLLGLVHLVGALLCGVGAIFTTPLAELMQAVGYTDMTGQTRTDV